VALVTIANGMALGKWEERMIDSGSRPGKYIDEMTLHAIGRKIACHMVGTCCRIIISLMTINTFNSQRFEAQRRGGGMTCHTLGGGMGSQKGKPTHLMYFGNIGNQPRLGGVAKGTFHADGLVVHIRVARGTLGLSSRKNQGAVARFAIHRLMLSGERKIGGAVVVKSVGAGLHGPAGSLMTIVAADS